MNKSFLGFGFRGVELWVFGIGRNDHNPKTLKQTITNVKPTFPEICVVFEISFCLPLLSLCSMAVLVLCL